MFVQAGLHAKGFPDRGQDGNQLASLDERASSAALLASMKLPNGRTFKDVEFAPGLSHPATSLKQADTAK
jgi:hypothetical protein